ncbi:hypothetical protein MSG28_014936 [Choristoneura fumiferana]|uniref:Uncharacterized protein n=1 Tax=Choristoneura fumiferana TaxID=7141 RepID=A0ACC0KY73_CHOFU|nr:hypothetical protein MSG28_014936 [Choristoneura fumiferana]
MVTCCSTYQKSSASAGIKPPDLWIHHDQMELKHLDKSLHSSAVSAGSVDGPSALASSTLTLTRAPAEYEPARHAPPASLDRRHYVPTYVVNISEFFYIICFLFCFVTLFGHARLAAVAILRGQRRDGAVTRVARARARAAPLRPLRLPDHDGRGRVGVGVGAGCAATCERRAHRPPHALPHPDQREAAAEVKVDKFRTLVEKQFLARVHGWAGLGAACCFILRFFSIRKRSTPLLAGVAPLSPQTSLGSLHAHAHHTLPLHPAHPAHPHAPPQQCTRRGRVSAGRGVRGGRGGAGGATPAGGDIYACAARERGHYVAYEPLGHYTHRDSLSSEAGTVGSLSGTSGAGTGAGTGAGAAAGAGVGSLQRRACAAPLHSFADSPHSTPSHGQGSVRETSPYKKSASSSPGHLPNRLQLGGAVAHCAEELEALTPSRSTERLAREMQNLEGLMKDLSAITQQQFHC